MDRVETLLQQLQQQFLQQASAETLLLTTQILQHELHHLIDSKPPASKNPVSISMPLHALSKVKAAVAKPEPEETESPMEKVFEVLEINEAEVEAELQEIRKNASVIQQMTNHTKPALLFDISENDIPTLPQQNTFVPALPVKPEVNEAVSTNTVSVNDVLKATTVEVSDKLKDTAVKDLRKAIGINERFLYINELFRGDEIMYERSIKTINSFSIYPEAEYWIRRELKTKLGWVDTDSSVKQFDQMVKRRFAFI